MIKFIPKATLKNNEEPKPKWINNKVKRCRKKTYYRKYLFISGTITQLMEKHVGNTMKKH